MQLDKRGKIQEGSCFHCSHSYPNLLVVSVIKIGLYIFTCGLDLWFHMPSLKLGASFWNLPNLSWIIAEEVKAQNTQPLSPLSGLPSGLERGLRPQSPWGMGGATWPRV